MAEPQGWIKLHRQILEHPIFSDPQAFSLWVQLLLRANHKDAKVMVGNRFVSVKRGQILTGRNKLAEHTNINRSKLERLLNMLESEHQIEQQKTTKYRLISITNYDKYQGDEQQVSIKRATSEHQVSTNKNDNNVNNENKYIFPCKDGEFTATDDYILGLQDSYKKIDVLQELGKAYQWILANPKKQKTVAGMPRFITNWLNRKKQGSSKIPHEEIAQCYNEHFAKPLGLNDCEEMTDARIQAASKIWFRKTEGEKRTDSIKYFKNYFAYCATRDTLSGVINGYAPTIDRLLKYETYIKTIEDAYRCQN